MLILKKIINNYNYKLLINSSFVFAIIESGVSFEYIFKLIWSSLLNIFNM